MKLNRIIFVVLCSAIMGLASLAFAASSNQFSSETLAQQHCPKGTVVWVNTKTGVYHYKGQRWYGRTKQGAYECQADTGADGARATRNGQ